jgi:hypothetical protein
MTDAEKLEFNCIANGHTFNGHACTACIASALQAARQAVLEEAAQTAADYGAGGWMSNEIAAAIRKLKEKP